MRRRLRCLWHKEETPSLVQQKNGFYCFGACRKLYTNEEVAARTGQVFEYDESEDYQEDVAETFKYIDTLPRVEVRGFLMPEEERGYYVCWPDRSFYKLRRYNETTGPKYVGPRGIKPPLFWARRAGNKSLILVEGEINALSIAAACEECDVVSPGSASSFNEDNLSKHLTDFSSYSNLKVILDDDAAGTRALIETKAYFLYKIPFISFIQISPDANEILLEQGKEALREKLQRANIK